MPCVIVLAVRAFDLIYNLRWDLELSSALEAVCRPDNRKAICHPQSGSYLMTVSAMTDTMPSRNSLAAVMRIVLVDRE